MAANPFDQFDAPAATSANPFDQFDAPATQTTGKKTPPSWLDVVRSAPVKAFAGAADTALNAMLSPGRMTNMMLNRNAPPEITPYTALGRQTGFIANTPNMTTGQKIADVGLQVATGSLFGPWTGLRAAGTNMLAAGLGGAAGEVVSEATGSPTAGLIASLAAIPAAGYGIRKTGAVMGDIFSPQQRAARLVKTTAAPTINEVRAAILMHPDKPVSEALMIEGVNNPAMQTLAQVTGTDARWTEALRKATTQQEIDDLAALAGGETQTAAITAQKEAKTKLNADTRQEREVPLYQAELYNIRGRAAEQQLADASEEASAAVEDVRRFTAVQDRANEWARNWTPSTGAGRPAGMPIPPVGATYPGELAQRAEQVATQRAGQSLEAGQARWEAQQTLASMKAAGLQPLRPDSILSYIRSASKDPAIAGEKQVQQVYKQVAAMLEDWVNQHGDISPQALYSIRKGGVSSIVNELLGSQSQQAKKQFSAMVIAKLNPVIDAAIEAAGGKGWIKYTKNYAAGMHKIEQQEFAAKALEMYNKNPKGFVDLVKGNNPDAIEAVFGPNTYDIAKEMGTNMGVLRKVAGQVERRIEAARLASVGEDELKKYASQTSSRFHLPNLLSRPAALANQVATLLQGRVDRKTLDLLAEGFKKGKSLEELLNVVPFKERVTVMNTLKNSAIYQPGALTATTNALSEP